MERDLRINWQLLVEEARHRRKAQGISQRRLSEIAQVSAPTVSRFEIGERDIQLSSALAILGVLGLTDRRTLSFPDPKPRYGTGLRDDIVFNGIDGEDKVVACRIGRMALFGKYADPRSDYLQVFSRHRLDIEHWARRKYLAGQVEPDGSVRLTREDEA